MVAPSVGAVILVRFPFSDLSSSRIRPAVCLADAGRGDWILCQVTSQPYGDLRSVIIRDSDFRTGSLRIESYARPGKLFTASSGLMSGSIGVLKPESLNTIIEAAIAVLRPVARS